MKESISGSLACSTVPPALSFAAVVNMFAEKGMVFTVMATKDPKDVFADIVDLFQKRGLGVRFSFFNVSLSLLPFLYTSAAVCTDFLTIFPVFFSLL